MNPEQQIADDLLSHSLDLLRLDAGLRKDAFSLLQKLQKELLAKLSGKALTEFGRSETAKLLKDVTSAIEGSFSNISAQVEVALNRLPAIEHGAVQEALVGAGFGAALAPVTHFAAALTDVMIQGAPSAEWWKRQSADTAFRFASTLRQGIVQGKTNQQIISELVGGAPIVRSVSPQIKIGSRIVPITMPRDSVARGDSFVWLNVEKFDKAFAKEPNFYIAKGGEGGIRNRYANFGEFAADAKTIEASQIAVAADGSAMFQNGRHRYAWFRDQGIKTIPVAMDSESVANAVKFGLLAPAPTVKIGVQTGILETSRRNVATLVQTSVQTVANVARLESFAQNADVVKAVKQLSTLDGHTTDICIAYSGGQWGLDGKPVGETILPFNGGPPRHWNCRSVLIPVTKTFRELGIRAPEPAQSLRASSEGPIAATTTFDDFLTRKGVAYQDKMLGPGRAQLWRDKKITLQQLLDLQGNPLTLAELEAKYKIPQSKR